VVFQRLMPAFHCLTGYCATMSREGILPWVWALSADCYAIVCRVIDGTAPRVCAACLCLPDILPDHRICSRGHCPLPGS
jgi:hypothetical protein